MFFFSEFFRILSDIFSDFWPKNFKRFQNYLLRVQRNNLCLQSFLKKFWTVIDFLQNPLALFSKFYLRVQSKNCGRNSFPIFLFRIFSDFEQNFQTFGQKTSRNCHNYPLRVERNNLWLEFFFNFWIVSYFLQKPLAGFSKFYPCVQSKNCGKNSFFCFLFSFFDFWAKFFQTFGQKTSKNCENYLCVSTWTTCGFKIFFQKFWTVLDFLQKPLAWFSKFYPSVQSKNCRISFFCFSFQSFYEFWAIYFQTFGQKTSNFCENYFLRVHSNNLWL